MKRARNVFETLKSKYWDFYGKARGEKEYKKSLEKTILLFVLAIVLFICLVVFTKSFLKALCFFLFMVFLIFKLMDSDIEKKMKERRNRYDLSMADFIERVALLLDSGLSLWLSIERASVTRDENSLEAEMLRTINEGKSLSDPCLAFSNLAKRSKSTSINSFASLIVQNYRKGQRELVDLMRLQAGIYRNERMNTAKRLGEEATTLMLIPTTIVFIAILIMLLSPAFMSLTFLINT